MAQQQTWSIDKRIPLAVILGMVGQAILLIVWVYGMDGRISVLENGKYEERLQNVEKSIPVIYEKIKSIKEGTDRIEKKLDKLSAVWPQRHSFEWQEQQTLLAEMKHLGEVTVS